MSRTSLVIRVSKHKEDVLQKREVVGLEEGIGCGGSSSYYVVDKLCADAGEGEICEQM